VAVGAATLGLGSRKGAEFVSREVGCTTWATWGATGGATASSWNRGPVAQPTSSAADSSNHTSESQYPHFIQAPKLT